MAAGCTGDEINVPEEIAQNSGNGDVDKDKDKDKNKDEDEDETPPPPPEPVDPRLTWSVDSVGFVYGSDYIFPTLFNPDEVSVDYSSTNEDVATISQTGEVTVIASGSATITATSPQTDKHLAGSASYVLTILKAKGELEWSEESCSAVFGEEVTFPVLNNPNGLEISWFSSDETVATISAEGEITILDAGTTTITASFEGDETREADATSYTLTVSRSDSDDGKGDYTFSSTGDPSSDDDISNTTFGRMITITFRENARATVTGDYHNTVSIDDNKVTVRNARNDEFIVYKLTGSTSNGYFKLYSEKKQAILLSGVSITNQEGAAINNQSDKRTFIVVEGINTLSDKPLASYYSKNEDMKAVLFSEGQLVFSGDGELNVYAINRIGKSAVVSDDYIRFMANPLIKVTSQKDAGNGIKANDFIQITSGRLGISIAADAKKGITSDRHVLVEGGDTSIKVTGGVAKEDNEFKGSAGIKADNYFAMTGGKVSITNYGNGGKGIRAGSLDYYTENGSLGESVISGGTITIKTYGNNKNDISSKGIKIGFNEGAVAGDLKVTGGNITVNCTRAEALEVKGVVTFSGGEHYFHSDIEDGINSQSGINITGGYICAISIKSDAIDSNADLRISGGMVYAVSVMSTGPELALDAMKEKGDKVYIEEGATVVAYGGMEPGAQFNQPTYKMDVTPGGLNALLDKDGKILAVFKAPEQALLMIVSAPGLTGGLSGITSSGGSSICQGNYLFPASISEGKPAVLTTYIPYTIHDPPNHR